MVIVSKERIQKQPGFMYFVGKDGYVWAAPMKHNKTGQKHRVGNEHIPPMGKMCFVNKDGYVETK